MQSKKHRTSKRRTLLSLYEEIQGQGYQGSYSAVRRYAGKWYAARNTMAEVYVPLTFGKGEAFQFDWSVEEVEIGGAVCSAGVAHFRLCHSRMSFLAAPEQAAILQAFGFQVVKGVLQKILLQHRVFIGLNVFFS